jgi:ankyrin repeat protein
MIELLIEVPFHINVHGTKAEKSLLYYAAMYGNIFFASHLIRLGFDIHESGNDERIHVDDEEGVGWKRLRYTPLYKAAEGGHTETVTFLLEAGADINRGGKLRYDTPLYIASANGHLKVVQVLIKNQAKYDSLEGVTHFFFRHFTLL